MFNKFVSSGLSCLGNSVNQKLDVEHNFQFANDKPSIGYVELKIL